MACVAGSTGLVGQYLLNVLLEDSFYDDLVALARRPASLESAKCRPVPTEFDDLTAGQLAGATHLFCCLGTTMKKAGSKEAFRRVDFDYCLRFARAGYEAGARHFLLVSSVGASASSSTYYLRVKGELEEAVGKIGFTSLHIFRPSVLLGKRAEERPGEQSGARLARAIEFLLVGSLSKYRPMPAGILAASLAAAGERGPVGRHVFHYREILGMAGLKAD